MLHYWGKEYVAAATMIESPLNLMVSPDSMRRYFAEKLDKLQTLYGFNKSFFNASLFRPKFLSHSRTTDQITWTLRYNFATISFLLLISSGELFRSIWLSHFHSLSILFIFFFFAQQQSSFLVQQLFTKITKNFTIMFYTLMLYHPNLFPEAAVYRFHAAI